MTLRNLGDDFTSTVVGINAYIRAAKDSENRKEAGYYIKQATCVINVFKSQMKDAGINQRDYKPTLLDLKLKVESTQLPVWRFTT
ncbi:hypothetical protein CMI45_03450 [Candidatus Pacearchaeota archaeon]|nr:hypothetical protein [Candidatus Pacearchaeota archaeon]|tara:strand:- start:262 stop:516 length:255 start_codon:yes stop_codon:yes gene_type:complete